jgi:hypothetical protein
MNYLGATNIPQGDIPPDWKLLSAIYEVINEAYKQASSTSTVTKQQHITAWNIIRDSLIAAAEDGVKKCYLCSGYGHHAEVCPSGKAIREIGLGMPKLKILITAGINKAKLTAI